MGNGIALEYYFSTLHEFQREIDAYDVFEKSETYPSSHVLQSFLRLQCINFLPRIASSLAQSMHANRRRVSETCIDVLILEPADKVERWIYETAKAGEWLADLGYVHGDLRPHNILLDYNVHVKLSDFDCLANWGSLCISNAVPWSRMNGGWHTCGTETEMFALYFSYK